MKKSELKSIIKECISESRVLNEASEVGMGDLSRGQQQTIINIEKVLKRKVDQIFDGVHGVIAIFDTGMSGGRMDINTAKALVKIPNLRWIEGDRDNIKVGF